MSRKNRYFCNVAAPAVASLLLMSSAAYAVLGETEAELVARYGRAHVLRNTGIPEMKMFDALFSWQKDGLEIEAWVIDGRSFVETYIFERDISGADDPLVEVVLKANGGDDPWVSNPGVVTIFKMRDEGEVNCVWLRKPKSPEDFETLGHEAVVYSDNPRKLVLRSRAFYRLREAFNAEAAK